MKNMMLANGIYGKQPSNLAAVCQNVAGMRKYLQKLRIVSQSYGEWKILPETVDRYVEKSVDIDPSEKG